MLIDPQIVKNSRSARGWTQQQLAEIAGLSLRTIQRMENQGQASHESCNALCAVLELHRQQLLLISPDAGSANKIPGWLLSVAFIAIFVIGIVVGILSAGWLAG